MEYPLNPQSLVHRVWDNTLTPSVRTNISYLATWLEDILTARAPNLDLQLLLVYVSMQSQ